MPGWLTGKIYLQPERLAPDEARRRKFVSALSKSRMELEVRTAPLSPANQFHLSKLKEFELKFSSEILSRRREVEALEKSGRAVENSRRYNAAVSGLFQRLQQRSLLRSRADAERRRNQRSKLIAEASAADRRFYFPGSFRNPRSIFGTEAVVLLNKRFRNPLLSIPCIQRVTRKQVMFARRHAGKAHRVRRRFNPLSAIGC